MFTTEDTESTEKDREALFGTLLFLSSSVLSVSSVVKMPLHHHLAPLAG